MSAFLIAVAVLAVVVIGLAWCLARTVTPEPEEPCWRCDGHGTIEIYSTSDEYGAPCPVCRGADAYHAKIERKEGCVPAELLWSPERALAARQNRAGETT